MESYTLAQSAPTPPPASPETPPKGKKFPPALIIGGVILGFIVFFFLGMLASSGRKGTTPTQTPTPTEVPTPTPQQKISLSPKPENANIQYQTGKPYYDDAIAIITKAEPHQIVQVSISRFGQHQGFTQYAKVNYFNGAVWSRGNVTTSIQRPDIITTPLISQWKIHANSGLQNGDGVDIMIEQKPLNFTPQRITQDISSQNLPGFTKFNYFGEGVLKTSDEQLPAYFLYSQAFSLNSTDVSYLSTPEKLKSDWMVFWDKDGTAYFQEKLTGASNPLQNYNTASIYTPDGTSQKFTSGTIYGSQTNEYSTSFASKPQTSVKFALNNPLNKATSKSYVWQTGIITGFVQIDQAKKEGIGIFETIHP